MPDNKKLDEIIEEIKKDGSGRSTEELLFSKLNDEQKDKLRSIISDDETVKKFLKSEKAKEVIKKLTGKGE